MRTYIKAFFDFLHSDEGLKLAGLIMTGAYLVKSLAADGSQANLIAGKVLEAGVILGISSTVGRSKNEPPKVP